MKLTQTIPAFRVTKAEKAAARRRAKQVADGNMSAYLRMLVRADAGLSNLPAVPVPDLTIEKKQR